MAGAFLVTGARSDKMEFTVANSKSRPSRDYPPGGDWGGVGSPSLTTTTPLMSFTEPSAGHDGISAIAGSRCACCDRG